jgi:hypothetical protein
LGPLRGHVAAALSALLDVGDGSCEGATVHNMKVPAVPLWPAPHRCRNQGELSEGDAGCGGSCMRGARVRGEVRGGLCTTAFEFPTRRGARVERSPPTRETPDYSGIGRRDTAPARRCEPGARRRSSRHALSIKNRRHAEKFRRRHVTNLTLTFRTLVGRWSARLDKFSRDLEITLFI